MAINYWHQNCYITNVRRLKGLYANVEEQFANFGLHFVSISEFEWKELKEDEQKSFIIEKIESKFLSIK